MSETETSAATAVSSAASDKRFRGKTIVITGAGGNFGREGALYFASRGCRVAAMDKNVSTLNETVQYVHDELKKLGMGPSKRAKAEGGEKVSENGELVKAFDCDVTDASSVESAVLSAIAAFEKIDLLWNNAGYQGQIKPTLDYDPVDFAAVMSINVTGMFIVLQAVAKKMAATNRVDVRAKSRQCGYAIVNTASVAGLRGTPAMIAYSSSKAAVLAMTVSAAKDLAPHGIRVNAVSPALIGPGHMWTRQNELHAKSGSPYFSTDPREVAEGKVNSVPMKRLGSTEEVLKSVAFLLSDDSSYTTATNLVVDGGMSGGLKA